MTADQNETQTRCLQAPVHAWLVCVCVSLSVNEIKAGLVWQ